MSARRESPPNPRHRSAAGSPADEPAPAENESGEIPGERGIPSVNRVRSVQSRVTSVLAVTLMGVARRRAHDLVLLGRDPPQAPGPKRSRKPPANAARKGRSTLPVFRCQFNRREPPARRRAEFDMDPLFGATAAASRLGAGDSDGDCESVRASGFRRRDAKDLPQNWTLRPTARGPVLAASPNDRASASAPATDGETPGSRSTSRACPRWRDRVAKNAPGGETAGCALEAHLDACRARAGAPDAALFAAEGRLH